MSRLSLYFLGSPRIECDGVPAEIDRRKAIALIAYLAVAGERCSRDKLAALFWPEYDQTRARAALRRALSSLNKALGEGRLEVEREAVGLNKSGDLWLDVDQFHSLLARCQTHGHTAAETCPDCLKMLTEAAEFYRDDFMAGFVLPDSPDFDDWQFFQTESLRRELAGALERLVSCQGTRGEVESAIAYARRWLKLDPLRQAAHRSLMELYALSGQRAAALRQYEECVRVLEKELGEAPEEATTRLYETIKENRLLPAQPPPPKPLSAYPNNLPRQLTTFIGREREIGEVKRLLTVTRLLTLTGSGGCGKTRLAIKVGADLLREFADGVWLVELGALSDPALVPQAAAGALGLREEPGYLPLGGAGPAMSGASEARPLMAKLSDYLRSKHILLVLDNCEHLIEACAALAEALLRACPSLRVLVTSREVLGIEGETAWRVPSLSLPDSLLKEKSSGSSEGQAFVSALTQYEAVRLFIDRALAALPTFVVTNRNAPAVAQVCHRLDGIPLAVELAAAWVKSLSVEQIAAWLDDRFRLLRGDGRKALPRQRTLRAVIDWSHDLLSEAERVLLRRLSVFAGGWTLRAAEAICADTVGADLGVSLVLPDEVLDTLTHLVDKSLVVAEEDGEEARYRLLDTIRQYSWDRLVESGEADVVRGRHRNWFLVLAEGAESELRGPDQEAWLERLEAEHDNLRAALERSLEGDEAEAGLRLGGALWWFWYVRGYLSEGRKWLESALSGSLVLERGEGSRAPESARAKVLYGAGALAMGQGDYGRAAALCQESLALCREIGDKIGIAFSLGNLAVVAYFQGGYKHAAALLEESLALFREVENKWGIALGLFLLGIVAQIQGDYAQAAGLLEESIALFRELRDRWGIAFSLSILGLVMLRQGNYQRASALLEESLALFRKLGHKWNIALVLRLLGEVAPVQGDYDRAEALCRESLSLFRELGHKWGIALVLRLLGQVLGHRGDYGQAAELYKESLVLRKEFGDKGGIAECLEGIAGIEGAGERAARLFGAAEALREAVGAPLPPSHRAEYDRSVAAARIELGEEEFTAAWTEGRKMALEEAVKLAVGRKQLAVNTGGGNGFRN